MNKDAKIFIAGHRGLVGSAIFRKLKEEGYTNIVTRTRDELDLTREEAVSAFFSEECPAYVFMAAAKVGGIHANNVFRADFLYENLKMQNNVIWSAYKSQVTKLLFLGSSCVYPKAAQQPILESELLQSPLEYTNEPYAIAKIAGMKLCESLNIQYGTNFITCMPTNLYGPGDNYDFRNAHVLPAVLRKVVLAKWWNLNEWDRIIVELNAPSRQAAMQELIRQGIGRNEIFLWGSGRPRREFLFSDDLASACLHIMEKVNHADVAKGLKEIRNTHINVGYGEDISIYELARLIAEVVGFDGEIHFDNTMPDGTYQKLMDSSRIFALGWKPVVKLREGIEKIYNLKFNGALEVTA